MSMLAASTKVNITCTTGARYYKIYKENPKQKVLVQPENQLTHPTVAYSKINKKADDGMNVKAASLKANMPYTTAYCIYRRYLDDPNRRIPNIKLNYGKHSSQHQIQQAIRYIVNDKLSIRFTALKLKMGKSTTRSHYLNYLRDSTTIKNE